MSTSRGGRSGPPMLGKAALGPSEVGGSAFSGLGSLTRGPGLSGAAGPCAGADPYLLDLFFQGQGSYQLGPQAYPHQLSARSGEHACGAEVAAALQGVGLAAGPFGLPYAALGAVKARLGDAGFAVVRAKVMAQQEVFVQQMYEMHRVATRQRHLQMACERPHALRAEIALQVTESRQRRTMSEMQARARDAQDAPRRDAWQAKADAKERVWRQEQGPDGAAGARRAPAAGFKPTGGAAAKPPAPARPQAVPPHAQLSTAGSGNKLEAASGSGQDAAQGSGQGSGQGTAQGSGREAPDQGSGQGSGQGVEGSGQGSPKLDSKTARSSDTGSAAGAQDVHPAAAAATHAKPSQHAQSLLHEAAPPAVSAQASPKPAAGVPDAAHAPAASALPLQLRGYAGPLGAGMPQGLPGAALGIGALPIAPLGAYPPGGGFGGFGAAPYFNPYCMVGGAGASPMGAPLGGPPALLGFDPLASWYAHHYARPGSVAGNPGVAPKPCQDPRVSGGQQAAAGAVAGAAAVSHGAVAVSTGVTGGAGAVGATPSRWWQDPAAVFGAEVLAGTLAPQAAAPSCGVSAGLGRRTKATSRPGCGEADEAPPAFLPPLKQRSKRARRSASGTDCDEVGQSGGPASGAPSPFAQKPYGRAPGPYDRVGASCGASDVLVSFAGSGGSAFRKVPQRRRSVAPAPAHADSIGSENSKSSFAACTGASGDADSGLRRPIKRAALTSAASILVSFSGNA